MSLQAEIAALAWAWQKRLPPPMRMSPSGAVRPDANDEAVKKLEGLGTGKISAWAVDVGEEAQVVKAMAEVEEHFRPD